MRRVLLLAKTTGYQTRSFNKAAAALDVELVFGLDRCRGLADPWGDRSLVVRYDEDPRSLEAILSAAPRLRRRDPAAGAAEASRLSCDAYVVLGGT